MLQRDHAHRRVRGAHDADMYRVWAPAVVDDAFDGSLERCYAVAARSCGVGHGRVLRVTGVDRAQELVGRLVVEAAMKAIIETIQVHHG
jgi:hypothetical protein